MRAIVQHGYGEPRSVLRPTEAEQPVPPDGGVLVRLRATSVNPPDVLVTRGLPYVLRPMMGTHRSRAGNADLARSLGADHVIDYERDDYTGGRSR